MTQRLDKLYEEIASMSNFDMNKLDAIGGFIDNSDDHKSLNHINLAKDYLETNLDCFEEQIEKCVCHYFLGVIYSCIRHYERENTEKSWEWDNENIDKEIINLRLAERLFIKDKLPIERYCQILTNLANIFDFVGRYIESMKYWNKVIEIEPRFGMAMANKGNSLVYHGLNTMMFEQSQRLYIQIGYKYLKKSKDLIVEPHALPDYLAKIDRLETTYSDIINNAIEIEEPAEFENEYHQKLIFWCINNRLLLNPYLDISNYDFARDDNISIPIDFNEAFPLFEQIKIEFRYARELFYKSKFLQCITDVEKNENLKLAFRIAYSIFDKVAYLINNIFDLQVANHRVSFRKLWYIKEHKEKGIKESLANNNNFILRGLFWISKELYLEDDKLLGAIEPDAKELDKIRNYIEHKSFLIDAPKTDSDFSYEISRDDFEAKTLRLLLLVRESIMYIPYSINRELKLERNTFANRIARPASNH
ncbi:LA2681 family HEPN domain-containing protein [Labilibaculum sp.]|uniref:LA2681 family HEPN domain-containing protein n=1 Tax=Labilibaculum sp. TaxID=2060723 RepID=UPI002AA7DC6E|nr:LA2681 family HEPN domain-containing protein [Labilibaculum sp.]